MVQNLVWDQLIYIMQPNIDKVYLFWMYDGRFIVRGTLQRKLWTLLCYYGRGYKYFSIVHRNNFKFSFR